MSKPFNTRSTTIKEEHKNDTFITPRQNIIDLGNYIKNNNLIKYSCFYTKLLFLDFCCGTGENKDNIYNNIKDIIIFNKRQHCYVGSDIDKLELTSNIKNNIESLKKLIYNKTKSKLSDFKDIIIIMNPPYKIKNIFLKTVIELRREVFETKMNEYKSSGNLKTSLLFSYFILLPTASFSSVVRKKILQGTEKPFLLANSKRIQFVDNGSSNLDTAWFCRSDVISCAFEEIVPLIKSNDFVD